MEFQLHDEEDVAVEEVEIFWNDVKSLIKENVILLFAVSESVTLV